MTFNYNFWNDLEIPSFILCNVDKSPIGILNVVDRKMTYSSEIPEISFKMYRLVDGELNPFYERVQELQFIFLDNIGYFQITSNPQTFEDEISEYKEVTAQSAEVEFGQKYLNVFTINMGTVESIDGVRLYDVANADKSLMDLILEKFPSWSVGHIDPALAVLQRSFEVDSTDVYSFMTSDMATAFDCVFLFDTIRNEINIYSNDTISEDTNIIISYDNLLKEVKLTPDIGSIKTAITLVGDDDLNVRELNMGYETIYNLDYFHDLDYMSQDLYDAYTEYKKKYEGLRKEYTPLLSEYNKIKKDIYRYQSNMFFELGDDSAKIAMLRTEIEQLNRKYNSKVNGNVDYTYRPYIKPEQMIEAGWTDFDGDVATTYSSYYEIEDSNGRPVYIDITPILNNKEILSPDELDKYVDGLNGSANVIKADSKKIVIAYSYDENKFNDEYYDELAEIKEAHYEVMSKLSELYNVDLFDFDVIGSSEKWVEYCIDELKSKKKSYENVLNVLMKAGYGEESSPEYHKQYYPTYVKIQEIDKEIANKEEKIKEFNASLDELQEKMKAIIEVVDIKANFTKEQWEFLSKFIREQTLNDSNYTVTESMSEEESQEMMQAFLEFGEKELERVSKPQLEVSLSMANIFNIPEFRESVDKFDLYNYITVLIRDDCNFKLKILSFDINFEDSKDITVTFGSMNKLGNNKFGLLEDAMSKSNSAATSVSFNRFNWNNGAKDAFDISTKLSSGLLNAGVSLTNSRSTMVIDDRGVFLKNAEDSTYPNDQLALTGSNLLFTDDNWKTVRAALGRITYKRHESDAVDTTTYGLLADAVIAGYVGGSVIEGTEIRGGKITGTEIIAGGDGDGSIRINNKEGKTLITMDCTGIWLSETIKLGYNNLNESDLVMITKDTINAPYINSLKIKAGSVDAENITGTTITGKKLVGNTINNGNGNFRVDENGNMFCNNVSAFQVSERGKNSFSQAVEDSEALRKANQALNEIRIHVDNINNVHIKNINDAILELQVKIADLHPGTTFDRIGGTE